jgi:hypothetical protein
VCKAILLCDRVIIDSITNNYSVINIFDRFEITGFPGNTRPFVVYLQLTSGIGSYEISIEVQDLRNDTVVARAQGPRIEFPERWFKAHMIAEVSSIRLEHAGMFDLVVLANGQEIDRQQFAALTPNEEPTDEGETEGPGQG